MWSASVDNQRHIAAGKDNSAGASATESTSGGSGRSVPASGQMMEVEGKEERKGEADDRFSTASLVRMLHGLHR